MSGLPEVICTKCNLEIFPFGTLWHHFDSDRWTCSNGAGVATPPEDIDAEEYREVGMALLSQWGVDSLMHGDNDE